MIQNRNIILDASTGYNLSSLSKLSRENKLHVIAFLTNSMLESERTNSDDEVLDRICGSWSDDVITTDELISVCESGRNRNQEIIEL